MTDPVSDTQEIRQTTKLPFGFQATFIWSQAGGAKVEWKPAVPRITSPRAYRKFREAYNAARRSFYQDIATCLGGNVLLVDIDGPIEAVRPATTH